MMFTRLQRLAVLSAVVSVLGASAMAGTDEDRYQRHRGYVDGKAFAAVGGDDGTLIEVSLHGPLLKMAAGAIGSEDKAVAELLEGIVSISAVIVDMNGDEDHAAREADELAERLTDKGWEKLARVREEDTNVSVFALVSDKDGLLDGLTVVVMESSENKLIFANIAGRIDLSKLGALAGGLNLPGLSQLAGADLGGAVKHRKGTKE